MFYREKKQKDGYGARCKKCDNERREKRRRILTTEARRLSAIKCLCSWCVPEDTSKEEDDYETNYSHYHCWESTNPPCGQKIEHYKCCLCEKLNPKVQEALTEQKMKFRKLIEIWISDSEYCSRCCSPKKFCPDFGKYPSAIDTKDFLKFLSELTNL